MMPFLRRAVPALLGALALVLFLSLLLPLAFERFSPAGDPKPSGSPSQPYPRLEQAAGAIDLLRDAPFLDAAAVRALNSTHLRARISRFAPPAPDGLRPAPRAAALVRSFAGLGADDDLRVYTDAPPSSTRTDIEGLPTMVVWRMPDGRTLVLREIDAVHPGATAARVFGLPAGLMVGLLGIVVAALALSVARLETRPLRQLAAAAAAFDGHGPGLPTESGGPPDVRRLVEAVRGMQDRVAVLLQERSFLVGAISHDLKTYLTRLRLRAENVADPGEQSRVVGDLDGMTDLIETALAFARGTTVSHRRSLVDMADLVAVEAAERAALGQQVAVSGDETTDALVWGDPVALRRVLSNLVDNAVKFGRGRIEVEVEVGPEWCRLLVDDDGPGVSAPDRAAIFSPFYRVEGSRNPRTGGSGLGLAIARQIVEAHGGRVAVEDGRIGGARFVVALPAARQPGRRCDSTLPAS